MSDLVAIVYPIEDRAREVMQSLRRLEAAHLLDLEDACCVTKDASGRVELHQSINVTARGALGGAFWGSLLGLLFLNPLLGLATGAATGAIAGRFTDVGISDDFMKQLGRTLQPGRSAIFVLIRRATFDKVAPELARFGGEIVHSSLSHEAEQRLRDALSGDARPLTPVERATQVVSLAPVP
jgi:uncharacterized membrane protein